MSRTPGKRDSQWTKYSIVTNAGKNGSITRRKTCLLDLVTRKLW